ITVPDISNLFFSTVIRGAEEAALAHGYSVLLGDTRYTPEREAQYAGMLRRKEADGLICLHRVPAALDDLIAGSEGPAPVINGCEISPGLDVCSARIDNLAAATEVVELLYSLGHRRIGVITGPVRSPLVQDRLKGVHNAAARHRAEKDLLIQ